MGAVLQALEDSGMKENTLVIFMSDNGMSFPFSKANCYLNSTKTPFIARWPRHIQPNSRNNTDYIAGVDFMETILEALEIQNPVLSDGRSYLPLLLGEKQTERDGVFTQFTSTAARRFYPMRCVQNKKYGYIFNAWADGETFYQNESMMGLTYKAMKAAAEENEEIAERVRMFHYRCREELYDFEKDPDALHNLAKDPDYGETLARLRNELGQEMRRSNDPVLPVFEQILPQWEE